MESGLEWTGKTGKRRFWGKRSGELMGKRALGGAYFKEKIELTVGASGERKIRMFVKDVWSFPKDIGVFDWEKDLEKPSERYMRRRDKLEEIRIPTIKTMRIVDERRVAMGDLTVDGSQFFDKHYFIKTYMELLSAGPRALTDPEKMYLAIEPKKIKRLIARNMTKAWKNGIILPSDGEEYSILLKPDGTWKVMVTDLSFLAVRTEKHTAGWLSKKIESLGKRLEHERKILSALGNPDLTKEERSKLSEYYEEIV